MDRAHETPSNVVAEDGEVIVEGPDGVAFSMTADAAQETSERLLVGAAEARGQEILRMAEADEDVEAGEAEAKPAAL
jgi:hypothetical protein